MLYNFMIYMIYSWKIFKITEIKGGNTYLLIAIKDIDNHIYFRVDIIYT